MPTATDDVTQARSAGSLHVGLMSGTSLDGIDGVLARFDAGDDGEHGAAAHGVRLLAHAHLPFDDATADGLLALNQSGPDELHRAALAGNALARACAVVVQRLLQAAQVPSHEVRAIGAHGQTVRHQPGVGDGTGYTWQLLNAALLAELTGIDVVADFRSRDVAAGGLGAPLVPAFHRAVFGASGEALAVLNVGGMANCTLLSSDGATTGFDCGPGNVLLDAWHRRWHSGRYDDGGAWAAGGRVLPRLLATLQAEPYFAQQPPKATGRDLFSPDWLAAALAAGATAADDPQDVQATLAELTAWSAAAAIRRTLPSAASVLVCGGGAYNQDLLGRLQARLGPTVAVGTTALRGVAPEHVEAAAFAWLAKAHIERRPGNLPAVTGARGPRVLGALYPGD